MNKGEGKEFDHPYKLLVEDAEIDNTEITNKEGYFSKMLKSSGKQTCKSLFDIAK